MSQPVEANQKTTDLKDCSRCFPFKQCVMLGEDRAETKLELDRTVIREGENIADCPFYKLQGLARAWPIFEREAK